MKGLNNTFGGLNALALNALETALMLAARNADEDVYQFMKGTPKTSFIVKLHDALVEIGYTVKRI